MAAHAAVSGELRCACASCWIAEQIRVVVHSAVLTAMWDKLGGSAFVAYVALRAWCLTLLVLAGCMHATRPQPSAAVEAQLHAHRDRIRLDVPVSGALVRSPLRIEGQARGNWFFEASFPVQLLDADQRVLARGIAQAQGEWMTEAFVPFSAELVFAVPVTPNGLLVLERDNPSGLPEHDDHIAVPVRFVTNE